MDKPPLFLRLSNKAKGLTRRQRIIISILAGNLIFEILPLPADRSELTAGLRRVQMHQRSKFMSTTTSTSTSDNPTDPNSQINTNQSGSPIPTSLMGPFVPPNHDSPFRVIVAERLCNMTAVLWETPQLPPPPRGQARGYLLIFR
jgi:hypothetical protein